MKGEHFTMATVLRNWIGGEWTASSATATDPVYNPATEEVIAEVPLSSKADVDRAVQNARKAFTSWSRTPVPKRARILFKYQQLLVDQWEELARLITQENGKSYGEAYGEVQRGIECVEFAAGAPSLRWASSCPTSPPTSNPACTVIRSAS